MPKKEKPPAAKKKGSRDAGERTGKGVTVAAAVAVALVAVAVAVVVGGEKKPVANETKKPATNETKLPRVPCGGATFKKFGKWLPGVGEEMEVCVEGEKPLKVTGLSDKPAVYYIKNLVKPNEMAKISSVLTPYMKPAVLRNDVTGELVLGDAKLTPWRKSNSTTFPGKNCMKTLNKRIAQLTRLPFDLILNSTVQLQTYGEGDRYMPHFDSSALEDLGVKIENMAMNEAFPYSGRILTLVMYFNTASSGKTVFPFSNNAAETNPFVASAMAEASVRTDFPSWVNYCKNLDSHPGLAIKPTAGDAVAFYNHHVPEDGVLGQMDEYSYHGSCPVASGETKTMANYWVNVDPAYFQNDPPPYPLKKKKKKKMKVVRD